MLRTIHPSNAFYGDILECNGSTSIHQQYLQFLLTEIYKSTITANPRFMWYLFREREVPHSLRKGARLFLPPAKSTTYETNSAHFCGTIIWNRRPSSIKPSRSILEFKINLKQPGNIDCECVICRK